MYNDKSFRKPSSNNSKIPPCLKSAINWSYELEPSMTGTIGIIKSKNFVRSFESKMSSLNK